MECSWSTLHQQADFRIYLGCCRSLLRVAGHAAGLLAVPALPINPGSILRLDSQIAAAHELLNNTQAAAILAKTPVSSSPQHAPIPLAAQLLALIGQETQANAEDNAGIRTEEAQAGLAMQQLLTSDLPAVYHSLHTSPPHAAAVTEAANIWSNAAARVRFASTTCVAEHTRTTQQVRMLDCLQGYHAQNKSTMPGTPGCTDAGGSCCS
jgi:hypothetical protein